MNWINKIIKAGENIKKAFHKRATKEDIANSDWMSCCKGPRLKVDFENNMWVCPDCNRHHRIKPKQRFDYLFGKGNYEIFKTPIPNDDPLNWTDSKSYKDRLKSRSIPIVRIATEKTGSPTIGRKKVRSTISPIKPVATIPMINANQNGTPLSTARALITPAPTTTSAGWAKLKTSVAL